MPSTRSLLPRLTLDFPDITFAPAQRFSWSPSTSTVFYDESASNDFATLLHELSHGILGHHTYSKDIELLSMEAAAWDKAIILAQTYNLTIDTDTAEGNLDTYREWLHARSTCPDCQATGYQTTKQTYHCVACHTDWRVNEARLCGLKRYSLTK